MCPAHIIDSFTITRFEFRHDRLIGDSQIKVPWRQFGFLELHTKSGLTGTGFIGAAASVATLSKQFESHALPGLYGKDPFSLLNTITRPRGGNRKAEIKGGFDHGVNQALWDLQGKIVELPLYRLLGGTSNKVRAYASGLGFNLPTAGIVEFFRQARHNFGFDAYKIKVGHPDIKWDLARLNAIREVVGLEATLMVDSNEAWSPKEAIARAHAYRDAGFDIFWFEDPIMRDDFDGLKAMMDAVPFSRVNSGEYLDLEGKWRLMEARAADVVNIHGHISDSMQAGRIAAHYGIPISLGNTPMEIGVHLTAALPEAIWMEYSFHNDQHLISNPVVFKDGYAYAPDVPGHGLNISDDARQNHAQPEVLSLEERAAQPVPKAPITLPPGLDGY